MMVNGSDNQLFLLVHTMTITECDYVVQAQFLHAFRDQSGLSDARLVCRRMRVQRPSRGNGGRHKNRLSAIHAPSLKHLMKRKSAKIRHHLRTIRIGSSNQSMPIRNESNSTENIPQLCESQFNTIAPVIQPPQIEKKPEPEIVYHNQLSSYSPPEETKNWLTRNRFEKYLRVFENFSGADMLRMSREDLIQICGQADGIRLYNSVHQKAIAPKLKIYVCRQNTSVFNAVFLSSHNHVELIERLAPLMGVAKDQVRDVFIEGPQSIHVQLNNDLISHIKEETMFSVDVLPDNGRVVLLLKNSSFVSCGRD